MDFLEFLEEGNVVLLVVFIDVKPEV